MSGQAKSCSAYFFSGSRRLLCERFTFYLMAVEWACFFLPSRCILMSCSIFGLDQVWGCCHVLLSALMYTSYDRKLLLLCGCVISMLVLLTVRAEVTKCDLMLKWTINFALLLKYLPTNMHHLSILVGSRINLALFYLSSGHLSTQ